MAQALLVNLDIDAGAEVVDILDRAGVKPSVALWMFAPEYEDWRIFLAGRPFDEPGTSQGYQLLSDALRAAGMDHAETLPIIILPMSDPFVRNVRRLYAKSKNFQGRRLGSQTIGGRFVEDAYVYRIA